MEYRVWYENSKEYVKDVTVLTNDNKLFKIDVIYSSLIPLSRKTHTIEFLSGLEALNQVIIGVGDIVKVTMGDKSAYAEVVFEIGSFAISMNEEDMQRLFPDNWNDNIKFLGELYCEQDVMEGVVNCLEVVGNIHQDKEKYMR